MGDFVIDALNRVTAQRITGLLVLVDALEAIDPSVSETTKLVRDNLNSLRESIERGENRDEEWKAAHEAVLKLATLNSREAPE